MPFLVRSSSESNDGIRVYTGSWNVESGEVLIGNKSSMMLTGLSHLSSIALWDGGSTFWLAYQSVNATEVSDDVDVSYLSPEDVSKTVFLNGLILEVDEGSYQATTDSGEEIQIGSVDHELERIEGVINAGDSDLIGGGIRDKKVCLIYRYNDPEDYTETYLFYGLYDIDAERWEWSSLIPVPREYAEGVMVLSRYGNNYFDGDGLYLCGEDTICFLDIENNLFVPLLHVTSAVERMMPGTTRRDEVRGFVRPTRVSGGLKDIVVCYMGLHSETSNEDYGVYYAVRSCKLLGVVAHAVCRQTSRIAWR
jgi:hypothetical protein